MRKRFVFLLIAAMPAIAAALAACTLEQASAPYSQMVSPNAQFGASGGGGGAGGGGGGGGGM